MKSATVVFVIAWLTSLSYAHEMRMWTAMNGSKQEAAFVKYEEPLVHMQRRDGTVLKVNRESLSDEDWLYVMKYNDEIGRIRVKLGTVTAYRITPNWNTEIGNQISFYLDSFGEVSVFRGKGMLFSLPVKTYTEGWYRHGYFRFNANKGEEYDPWAVSSLNLYGSYLPNQPFSVTEGACEVPPGSKLTQNRIALAYWKLDSDGRRFTQMPDIILDFCSMSADRELSDILYKISIFEKTMKEGSPRYCRLLQLISKEKEGLPKNINNAHEDNLLGTGSGFFISPSGYFLTNYHVVEGGNKISLMTENGLVPAKIIRIDPDLDIALLQAKPGSYDSIPFLEKQDPSLGTDIFTIGFPMPDLQGFSPKLTRGVISSMKGLRDDDTKYQIDASIQPGNSGGPVVNNNGEVVGVVVSFLRSSYVAETKGVLPQNVNYAIKKKHVLDFLSQVPKCAKEIKTSNIPPSGKSAEASIIDLVQKSCAMVIVYE